MVLRDRNADANSGTGEYGTSGSGLEERLYALEDANFNVVAIAEPDGDVAERYRYHLAYGYSNALTPTFGYRASTLYDWQYLYTGRDVDLQTWLYNYRTRPYHPYLGRFTTRDPIGYRAGDMNLYRYVHNQPVSAVDPWGEAKKTHSWRGQKYAPGAKVPTLGTFYQDEYYERNWLFLKVPPADGLRFGPVEFEPDIKQGIPDLRCVGSRGGRARLQPIADVAEGTAEAVETVYSAGATAVKINYAVSMALLPGPDDAVWAALGTKYGLKLVIGKGGEKVLMKHGTELVGREADEALELILRESGRKELGQQAKRRLAKELGSIPRSAQPCTQGTYGKGTRWWEYTDSHGQRKLIVEHPDGTVHVGTPKPQSTHLEGGAPKYYPIPGTRHVGE